jgi:hypothetical protein
VLRNANYEASRPAQVRDNVFTEFGCFQTDVNGRNYRDNWLAGQTKAIWGQPGAREAMEEWAVEYGGVYHRPGPFGSGDLTIVDPKAAAHMLGSSEVCSLKPRPIRLKDSLSYVESVPPSRSISTYDGESRLFLSPFGWSEKLI